MTKSFTGHLFDVYPNETNLTVWLIAQDGRRLRFVQDFTPALYAAGPAERLRQLWKWLTQQPTPVRLSRTERRDIFSGMTSVLSVEVLQPARLDGLFRSMVSAFPDLSWYDADISIPLRYMAAFNVFPLAHVRLEVQAPAAPDSEVSEISEVSRLELETPTPGFRSPKDPQHHAAGYPLGYRPRTRPPAHPFA